MNTLLSAFVGCGISLCFAPPVDPGYLSPQWQGQDLAYWRPRTQRPFTANERASAIVALGRLASRSSHIRRDEQQAVKWTVGEIVPALLALLDDPDKKIRWQAVVALAAAEKDANAAEGPAFIRLLKDPDPKVQETTARAFATRRNLSDAAVAALLELINGNSTHSAYNLAMQPLRTAGPAGLAALKTLLDSPDASVRAAALSLFEHAYPTENSHVTPPEVQARIIELLDDPDPKIQNSAALAIVRLEPPPLKEIRKLLKHPDPIVVDQTIRSLLLPMKPGAIPCADEVFAIISADASLQKKYVSYLRGLGPQAIPLMIKLLDDNDANVRRHAADGLARVGPPAKEAVPALKRLLTDMTVLNKTSKHRVCHAAAQALNSILQTSEYSKNLPRLEPDGK